MPTTDTLPPFTVSPEFAAQTVARAQAAAAPKSGVATTEFWLHLAALAVPLILQAAGQSQNVVVIAAAQVAASLYTLARTWIKAKSAPTSYTISLAQTPVAPPAP